VAGNWRIRHKLMLGLGLVIAIMLLMLAGTLKGLLSYRATRQTLDNRLDELMEADKLLGAAKGLAGPVDGLSTQAATLRERIKDALQALDKYRQKLEETIRQGRAPDQGYQETVQLKGLEDRFAKLETVLQKAIREPTSGTADLLEKDHPVRLAIEDLITTADDLRNTIYSNLRDRIRSSRKDYEISLGIVLSTAVIGVVMMLGLLRFFYRWVFFPIRDLQQGVDKIANGNFEHRIDVRSGDEIEDLAKAFNDMTGRLRDMYRDLARQVNERSRQLVRSERLASVGFLAAGVAHEINNPLASIAFCSEALERRLVDLLESGLAARVSNIDQEREIIAKYLKMIQEEAFRCKEITQKLLEFSRGGERRREPTDLAELIQGVLDMVQHLQNGKGKELIFHPGPPLTAWVNAQEIKSVVLNLVVNALDSMDEGGKLKITLGLRDGLAEMVFQDTGCGMSGEVLENIFEPFFTRSRTGKGTGLGLSISHRIINQHGGEIEATSPGPNQGSTFIVRLPLQPVEEKKEPEPEKEPTFINRIRKAA
jgi:two-component system NtrC family sensor kinase